MAQMFRINNTDYTTNEAGTYYYKTGANGKKWRIAKCEYEQAFDEYVNQKADEADADEWENEMAEAKAEAAKKQEKSDKAAEDAFNKTLDKMNKKQNRENNFVNITADDVKKEMKKSRRSKDVAYEMVKLDGGVSTSVVTLTAKQVDFLKEMTKTSFYENGVESSLWCDVLAEEIGGQFGDKPMTVGAMISTIREKDLVVVGRDRINGRMAKFMMFTDLGKEVLKDLGLD